MIVKNVPMNMFIWKIEEHQEYKERLLSLISSMPDISYETVSKTDWTLEREYPRRYLQVFYQEILDGKNKYLDMQKDFYEAKGVEIANGWFQQYSDNSEHIWHRHGMANYTNVYFLELPDKEHRTEIENIEYDAEEGYLISFPAHILHRCKPSKKRKTVIAFNTNVV